MEARQAQQGNTVVCKKDDPIFRGSPPLPHAYFQEKSIILQKKLKKNNNI